MPHRHGWHHQQVPHTAPGLWAAQPHQWQDRWCHWWLNSTSQQVTAIIPCNIHHKKKLYSMGSRTSKEGTYTSCAVLTSYIESVISAGSSVISSHTTSSSSISSSISVSRTVSRGDFLTKKNCGLRVYLNEDYPHTQPLQSILQLTHHS